MHMLNMNIQIAGLSVAPNVDGIFINGSTIYVNEGLIPRKPLIGNSAISIHRDPNNV